MVIYLIRHGETDANAARIVQRPSVSLSARGQEQARALARRLADVGIGEIVASDLQRATETASALAATTAAPIVFDSGLHERNYGDVRGTPYADLPTDIFAPSYTPPGGETWDAFHARVDAAWARAVRRARDRTDALAVVTHGLVCQRILSAHLDPPAAHDGAATHWGNTSVTIIEGRTVQLLACTAHLTAPTVGARA